jgi:putative ATP-dependent endonuclease of OLD family
VRIRHVSWENFRRLPDAHIDVRDHLVLLGPNDTGKSSVVRALHMCLGMAHGQVQAAITARDFTDETQPLTITVTLDGVEPEDRAAFPDEITAISPEVLVIRLEATLDPADPEQKTVRRTFPDSGHPRGPTKDQLQAIGFQYVPAARSMLRELGSTSPPTAAHSKPRPTSTATRSTALPPSGSSARISPTPSHQRSRSPSGTTMSALSPTPKRSTTHSRA